MQVFILICIALLHSCRDRVSDVVVDTLEQQGSQDRQGKE